MQKQLTHWINQYWYQKKAPHWFFKPLAWLYSLGQMIDKKTQTVHPSPLPVIVVGNLSVGGTGKTPVVIALATFLKEKGYRVGIVTRGYKNQLTCFPHLVKDTDDATIIGDEAALLSQKTKLPIVISPNRKDAVEYLYQHQLCDMVISDDGLQHYAMARKLEIVVIDGMRGFGNGALLPIGPLREPLNRLKSVDFILINGKPNPSLQEKLQAFQDKTFIMEMQSLPLPPLPEPIAAFAGIGHPERFFQTLRDLNITFTPYPFPDHHHYVTKDFDIPESCIIMTEKDAIKCQDIYHKPLYVLAIEAKLPDVFWGKFLNFMS